MPHTYNIAPLVRLMTASLVRKVKSGESEEIFEFMDSKRQMRLSLSSCVFCYTRGVQYVPPLYHIPSIFTLSPDYDSSVNNPSTSAASDIFRYWDRMINAHDKS